VNDSRTPADLQLLHSGKVREMYEIDDRHLLMVATDRMSAFDVIFDEPVPSKGRVLTAMTVWWSEFLSDVSPTHVVSADLLSLTGRIDVDAMNGRALIVRRAEMLPLECIVRGYITGSAWKEYSETGTMHGAQLPEGMLESQQLPEPVFTPSTKAEEGHDENISFEAAVDLVGLEMAEKAREISVRAYRQAAAHAADRGVIIADTKFELGVIDGQLMIADEMLTPDSSRFWPADQWEPGSTPPSMDKQPVRDFSASTGWNKQPPAPPLPPEVVAATAARYVEAYERITGESFANWPGGGS
jgi:phosphoribosylaminoimidazole-succinocarboxamide synthase